MRYGRLVAATGFVASLVGGASLAADQPAKPNLDEPRLIARGETVYAEHCGSCHGAKLEGQPNWRKRLPSGRLPAPPHDASGHTWHHSDEQLFAMTKHGMAGYETDMPAYKDKLSDPDIWAVLAFIKSTWPRDIRDRQRRLGR